MPWNLPVETPEQYAGHGGVHCPRCKSENIQGDHGLDSDAGMAFQNCSCNDCGVSWVDRYQLIGYSELGEEAA